MKLDEKALEAAAQVIYETWIDKPGYVSWTVRGNSDKQVDARRAAHKAITAYLTAAPPAPVVVAKVIHCPECGAIHIDEGEWATRLHKTHQCQSCKHEWRPYPYATVGVPAPVGEVEGLVKRLLSNEPLPICPFDRRSPEYFTTREDEPCKFCGQENTAEGPDKCRGADTRLLKEAADALTSLSARLAECEQERDEHKQTATWAADQMTNVRKELDYLRAANITPLIQRAEAAEARLAECERDLKQNDIHIGSQMKLIYAVIDAVADHWFLDPPDGGEVSLADGVKRIEDAYLAATARAEALEKERDEARVEIIAAKLFGGGLYGEQVDDGVRNYYYLAARAARDALNKGEG